MDQEPAEEYLLNVITPPVTPVIYNDGESRPVDQSAEFRRVVTANWAALRSVAQWYYGDETATTSAGTSNQAPEKKMNCPNCKAYLEVSKFTKDKWQKLVCPLLQEVVQGVGRDPMRPAGDASARGDVARGSPARMAAGLRVPGRV